MTSSGYGRVTVIKNSDTDEWQAVATVVLLLSQTRTLMNDKQWLRSCYCYHKLKHWGMTSSGYGRVTVITNSDTEEWQAVATVVLLLSQTRTLRNDKQWLRSCNCCHKLGHWWRTSSGYGRVTVVRNSNTEEWQAVTTVVLLLSQTRTLRNDKHWLQSCYCCHKLGHRGMTNSGYDRVTVVTNSDTEEWQTVAKLVLLLSNTRW
jgi:cell division inhibitor SulA